MVGIHIMCVYVLSVFLCLCVDFKIKVFCSCQDISILPCLAASHSHFIGQIYSFNLNLISLMMQYMIYMLNGDLYMIYSYNFKVTGALGILSDPMFTVKGQR